MNELLRYRNIIIGVVIIAVFSLIIYSIYTHYTDQLQGLKAKQVELQNGNVTIEKWQTIQAKYASLGQQLLRSDTALFKQFVEEKARASDINITALNMSQEDKGYYWKVGIDFDATCFYRDLINFASLLEQKKVRIVSATITKKNTQGKTEEGVSLKGRVEGVVIK